MEKRVFIYLLIILFTSVCYAAQYKINSKGQVVSPQGQVQVQSNQIQPQNYFNNYRANEYIEQRQAQKGNISTIDIVMDYSGSMYYWIEAAKKAMAAIISQIPNNVNTGFRVFGNDNGHNPYDPILSKVKSIAKNSKGKYSITTENQDYIGKKTSSCSATQSLAEVAPLNSSLLLSRMNRTSVGGMTPLTLALNQAVDVDFSKFDNVSKKKIILITDGDENCGGDPCAFARALMSKRKDITIDVVLVSNSSRNLTCLANLTGGRFYNPLDGNSFVQSIMESVSGSDEIVPETKQQYEYTEN